MSLILVQHDVKVEVKILRRVLALYVVPPVTDPVLLVKDGSSRTEE